MNRIIICYLPFKFTNALYRSLNNVSQDLSKFKVEGVNSSFKLLGTLEVCTVHNASIASIMVSQDSGSSK